MKKQILLLSHRSFADGLKDTLEYIAPGLANVKAVSCYLSNDNPSDNIEQTINEFDKSKPILLFTDMLGGSVTQLVAQLIKKYPIKIIAGMNLPIVLAAALSESEDYSDEFIETLIEDNKNSIVYVNNRMTHMLTDEDE